MSRKIQETKKTPKHEDLPWVQGSLGYALEPGDGYTYKVRHAASVRQWVVLWRPKGSSEEYEAAFFKTKDDARAFVAHTYGVNSRRSKREEKVTEPVPRVELRPSSYATQGNLPTTLIAMGFWFKQQGVEYTTNPIWNAIGTLVESLGVDKGIRAWTEAVAGSLLDELKRLEEKHLTPIPEWAMVPESDEVVENQDDGEYDVLGKQDF
jgi:hypothetical protein